MRSINPYKIVYLWACDFERKIRKGNDPIFFGSICVSLVLGEQLLIISKIIDEIFASVEIWGNIPIQKFEKKLLFYGMAVLLWIPIYYYFKTIHRKVISNHEYKWVSVRSWFANSVVILLIVGQMIIIIITAPTPR